MSDLDAFGSSRLGDFRESPLADRLIDPCAGSWQRFNRESTLLAYWKFDDADWIDSIAGRQFTATGNVALSTGKLGSGVRLADSSLDESDTGELETPDFPILRLDQGSFTIRFWFLSAFDQHTPHAPVTLMGKSDESTSGWYFILGWGNGNPQHLLLSFLMRNATTSVQANATIFLPTAFHHMVAVYDQPANLLKLYLDTSAAVHVVDTSGFTMASSNLSMKIKNGGRLVRFDELGFWSFPWTAAQVDCDYRNNAGATWPFPDG